MNLHTALRAHRPGQGARTRSSYGMHDSEKLFGALGLENGQAFLDLAAARAITRCARPASWGRRGAFWPWTGPRNWCATSPPGPRPRA
jgi:hypothetical protein